MTDSIEKIYILRLEDGKYYVGKSQNVNFRVAAHFNGNGSVWTKKYRPLEVLKIVESTDKFDEDIITLRLMEKHGIDNVRGGSFSALHLGSQIQTIEKMIQSSGDKCFKCGQKGHFAAKCTNLKCTRCGRNSHSIENCFAKTSIDGKPLIGCTRCGRNSHSVEDCYATIDVNGKEILESTQEECLIL